jgi:hypothetical protein
MGFEISCVVVAVGNTQWNPGSLRQSDDIATKVMDVTVYDGIGAVLS